MARQARIEFEGASHHVMSRGNDGILIFRDEDDRRFFLELLGQEVVRSGWTLHDYCLMGNHYHLYMTTPECTLSSGMHRLLGRYVQRFNRRHGRRGHLFQERFKSVLVEDETHGLVVSRYIALNPVRADLCARPEEWPWSSYPARAGFGPVPPWLAIDPLASSFGAGRESRQGAYREFVLARAGLSDQVVVENPVARLFIGTPDWIGRIQETIDQEERSVEHPRGQVHPGRPDLDSVIAAVAQTFDMTVEAIRNGRGTLARRIAAYLAFEDGLVRLRDIAEALGLLSAGRVSSLIAHLRRELDSESRLRDLLAACRGRMKRKPPPFLLATKGQFPGARRYHRVSSLTRR